MNFDTRKCSVDEKKRLTIPSVFREFFKSKLVLFLLLDNCVHLIDSANLESFMKQFPGAVPLTSIKIDNQFRILLKSDLFEIFPKLFDKDSTFVILHKGLHSITIHFSRETFLRVVSYNATL